MCMQCICIHAYKTNGMQGNMQKGLSLETDQFIPLAKKYFVLETNAFGTGDECVCCWRQKHLLMESKVFRASALQMSVLFITPCL